MDGRRNLGFLALILAAVVDNDQLEIGEGLAEHRANGFGDVFLDIVDRHDDGNGWVFHDFGSLSGEESGAQGMRQERAQGGAGYGGFKRAPTRKLADIELAHGLLHAEGKLSVAARALYRSLGIPEADAINIIGFHAKAKTLVSWRDLFHRHAAIGGPIGCRGPHTQADGPFRLPLGHRPVRHSPACAPVTVWQRTRR